VPSPPSGADLMTDYVECKIFYFSLASYILRCIDANLK